jgi:hypothetical protein
MNVRLRKLREETAKLDEQPFPESSLDKFALSNELK